MSLENQSEVYSNSSITNLNEIDEVSSKRTKNKGTGAGGANTNVNGKLFENKTDNSFELLNIGYEYENINLNTKNNKHFKVLSKKFDDKKVTFVNQSKLKTYMKLKYDKELYRHPDEAYIIAFLSFL